MVMHAQAMSAADPQARWLMQAWLFYDNQDFWKPPQIQASALIPPLCTPSAACACRKTCIAFDAAAAAGHLSGKRMGSISLSEVHMSPCSHTSGHDCAGRITSQA